MLKFKTLVCFKSDCLNLLQRMKVGILCFCFCDLVRLIFRNFSAIQTNIESLLGLDVVLVDEILPKAKVLLYIAAIFVLRWPSMKSHYSVNFDPSFLHQVVIRHVYSFLFERAQVVCRHLLTRLVFCLNC